ncbi:MAG: hypothetical protein RLZZ502_1295, partial [Pseudomonadota bacterium]
RRRPRHEVAIAPPQKQPVRTGVAVKKTSSKKLFIVDTNVLLHDPSCLTRFEEHDVFLPMIVLEELDHHKKGQHDVARNARQISRVLDSLMQTAKDNIAQGLPLASLSKAASGSLFLQIDLSLTTLEGLATDKADNQILSVTMHLAKTMGQRQVVLVSKDINMRIKARALGLAAEDYFNDQVLEDSELLYTGMHCVDKDFWQKHSRSYPKGSKSKTEFILSGPDVQRFLPNMLVYENGAEAYRVMTATHASAELKTLNDHSHELHQVWGIRARNLEQNFALNLLLDPEIEFVSLLGQAGTGKTLLTLAAALQLTFDAHQYSEIIITRVTVPVGDDIGFLPGTEEEKMTPWMGALEDNLEVLTQSSTHARHEGGNWGKQSSLDLLKSKIKIKSLNFMRGRTFLNKFVIIDEAQNLTPKQMKTLITRAGPGTKMVCLGNLAQIDTPYLSEGSSGLTYVVDRFKGWPHNGHITLKRGERSRLADYASSHL